MIFAWFGNILYYLVSDVDDDGGNFEYFGTYGNSVWSKYYCVWFASVTVVYLIVYSDCLL